MRLRMIRLTLSMACVAATCLAQAGARGEHWVATWGTAESMAALGGRGGGRGTVAPPAPGTAVQPPAPPRTPAPAGRGPQRRFPIPPFLPSLENQTVRMVVRSSIGGRRVRIRLSNAVGAGQIRLGSAHIALRAKESEIVPGSDRPLTFGGEASVRMYSGQTLVSDPVDLSVAPLSDLAISLYFPENTGAPTSHLFGLHTTYVSGAGDLTGSASIPDGSTTQSYYWLAGVDVLAPATAGTLVTLGDSITDGDQSTNDTNGMWPAILAARLKSGKNTGRIGVVNAGIAGNRVLGDGGALARIYHDVMGQPGIRWIMLLEGINDITGGTRANAPQPLKAEELIAAYRQIIEIAHLYGLKIIGCTITPFGGSSVYNDAGEAIRESLNQWIRTPGHFDAFVDFDAAVRDPQDPKRFRPQADSPDMLHPGDAGYKLMGEAVDLSIFGSGKGSSR